MNTSKTKSPPRTFSAHFQAADDFKSCWICINVCKRPFHTPSRKQSQARQNCPKGYLDGTACKLSVVATRLSVNLHVGRRSWGHIVITRKVRSDSRTPALRLKERDDSHYGVISLVVTTGPWQWIHLLWALKGFGCLLLLNHNQQPIGFTFYTKDNALTFNLHCSCKATKTSWKVSRAATVNPWLD